MPVPTSSTTEILPLGPWKRARMRMLIPCRRQSELLCKSRDSKSRLAWHACAAPLRAQARWRGTQGVVSSVDDVWGMPTSASIAPVCCPRQGRALTETLRRHPGWAASGQSRRCPLISTRAAAQARPPQTTVPRSDGRLGRSAGSRWLGHSCPLRNGKPTRNRGPGQAALEPARNVLQGIELNEVAGTVEANEVANPTQHGNVGDREVFSHDPLPVAEARFKNAKQALGLVAVALQRPLVGDVAARELKKVADLAEHRSDKGHLKKHPLDRLVAWRRAGRHKFGGLIRQVKEDGP